MSTLAVYLEEKRFTIVNDSMSYDNKRPGGFVSKTKTYPHLRCAINCMGLSKVRSDYEEFMKGTNAHDFNSLIEHTKENFFLFLETKYQLDVYPDFAPPESGLVSSIFIMGYSEVDRKMEAHIFYIYKDHMDHKIECTNGRVIYHPELSREKEDQAKELAKKKYIRSERGDIKEDYLVAALIIMNSDFKNREPSSVPSGLEIQSTVISCEPDFYIKQSIPYRFPDFYKDMLAIHDYSDEVRDQRADFKIFNKALTDEGVRIKYEGSNKGSDLLRP